MYLKFKSHNLSEIQPNVFAVVMSRVLTFQNDYEFTIWVIPFSIGPKIHGFCYYVFDQFINWISPPTINSKFCNLERLKYD